MTKHKIKFIIAAALIVIISTGFLIARSVYLNNLRTQMHGHIDEAVLYMQSGDFGNALITAQKALVPAAKLRDEAAEKLINNYIRLSRTVIRADTEYSEKNYHAALSDYQTALLYVPDSDDSITAYINKMIISADRYIDFYEMIENAAGLADAGDYEAALSLYENAAQVAYTISFKEGIKQAEDGAELMQEQIALLKWISDMRLKAETHIVRGDTLLYIGQYSSAVEEYQTAGAIYTEINDITDTDYAAERITYTILRQAEAEAAAAAAETKTETGSTDNTYTAESTPDTTINDGDLETMYDYNREIYFDLSTMIDRQNTEPASLVKMGKTDNRNEGWYNGCGWIAIYNVLIKLGNPQHPADIVKSIEDSGGAVLGGVFGTYPNAIAQYFIDFGYSTEHTVFPGSRINLDEAVKNAGAGIIAYAHTSAAHYAAVIYSESDGMFIVYNDSYARARSSSLGLSDPEGIGAVIDSIDEWISKTPEILFTFSLITINR